MNDIYKKVVNTLSEGKSISLLTEADASEGSVKSGIRRVLTDTGYVTDGKGRNVSGVIFERTEDGFSVTEPFMPEERLIVLGGGHIALPVSVMGAMCGFKVCVVDDRPEFAVKDRFPDASEVICSPYEEGIKKLGIRPSDYVIIITHGHRYDADCLRAVIPGTMPAYLGMIGSRKRVSAQMEMLKGEGFDVSRLDSVCTPIGLDIGAVTPEEIAVSIIAEVIAYRRLAKYAGAGRSFAETDAEIPVLERLADLDAPAALATVVRAEGSSPRGAGAKMIVFADGTILGSVGGGMGEAAVIREAVSIIGTGRYRLMDIDLTGDVSSYDAMACGGSISVLVEDLAD